jgi:cell division control protein 45
LLEHPNISGETSENKNPNNGPLKAKSISATRDQLHDNFWVAYDALELNSHSKLGLIHKGIEQTKEMQQAIVRVGTSIIERKEVKQHPAYRYVFIENTFLKDIQLFQYPLALSKLGLFIMQAFRYRHEKAKNKPLILSIANPEKKTNLVIGVLGPNRDSAS